MRCRSVAIAVAFGLLLVGLAGAEVHVAVENNASGSASGAFKFKVIGPPLQNDAAGKGKFTLVDGERDINGGELEKLNDGRVAGEEDQPAESFFFAAGTDGGRLVLDLGSVIEIKQINSYSWHRRMRGPQVYKLYAADGAAQGFVAQPKKGTDPATCGWRLIANVDTRPKEGRGGGQYGVSVSDSAGTIGKYRYVLFDIARTESADTFGNTFYTEFDVIDAGGAPGVAAVASRPGMPAAVSYEIIIDYSEMPELKDWVETKLRPTLEKWYPIIVQTLPSEGYTAPQRFTVTFQKNGRGVAATAGTRVMCAGTWFKQNLEGEAVGAVVHELVHVAQQYRSRRNPGWLVEGVADYIRWFKYEPAALRPRPNPARARYTDSYRVTAAFLEYVASKHDHEIVVKFNAAMREGRYSPELWQEYTGKTVDELWEEYVKVLKGE